MKPILFLDIDGCVRPTGNLLAQLDGEAVVTPGMTMFNLVFQRVGGLSKVIRFTDEAGEKQRIPEGGEWTQQLPVMNHMVDFLRRAHDLFDCRWCSWWNPDAIRSLMTALGLEHANWTIEEPPNFIRAAVGNSGGQFSRAYDDAKWATVSNQHDGRPFVWVDDCEITPRAHQWATELPIPALCVISDHTTGVSTDQIAAMEKFSQDLTAA